MTLKLSDLPEVSFAEKEIEKILSDSITDYEKAYFESTGVRKKLYPGDPIRIWLYSQALREIQLRYMIDDAAKQNLLAYSRGENLIQLGAFSRTVPLTAEFATVRMKFNLSQARATDEVIRSQTRVSPGNEIYFSVKEETVVPAGETEAIVEVTCLQAGTIGNGFTPGQINILVDPIRWIKSVENIEVSSGGADKESEDNYRDRVHLAPEGFSVAGPDGAYEYFARQYSVLIQDIRISSPSPGVVDVCVLLKGGEIPTQSFLDGLKKFLNQNERRPLTDKVEGSPPSEIYYDLDLIYFIRSEDVGTEDLIKNRVEQAIRDYEVWQRSKIGRDINPSELTSRVIRAGAKRVQINNPTFVTIGPNDLAVLSSRNVEYGGLEDE